MKFQQLLSNHNRVEFEAVTDQCLARKEDTFTFKVVLNGSQNFILGSKKLSLFPDCFMLIAPDTAYHSIVEANEPVHTLSIALTKDYIEDFHLNRIQDPAISELHRIARNGLPVPAMYPLRGDMRFNFKNLAKRMLNGALEEPLLNEYLRHCLINYYKLYHEEFNLKLEKLNFVHASTKKEIFKRLALAKEYISTNYNRHFSLDEVAAFSCLSVNHLLRTFKQAYGVSPYQYLTLVRLNRARIYLETGKYAVNEIVMLVGFESVSSFIRLFKSTFHITPLKFKKQFAI